jgi:hypothetical protein
VGYKATPEEERKGGVIRKSSRKVIPDVQHLFLGFLEPRFYNA